MPGKNRPKRLNRNISWRVARRKKRINDRASGGGRTRAPRPKKKLSKENSNTSKAKVLEVDKGASKVIKKKGSEE